MSLSLIQDGVAMDQNHADPPTVPAFFLALIVPLWFLGADGSGHEQDPDLTVGGSNVVADLQDCEANHYLSTLIPGRVTGGTGPFPN